MNPLLAAALAAGPVLITPDKDLFSLQETTYQATTEEGWVFVTATHRFANPFAQTVDATFLTQLPVGAMVRGVETRGTRSNSPSNTWLPCRSRPGRAP
ncbi:MAG: hypothetical protein AAGA48_03590 [Myxococcota bacterium]